LRTAACIAVRRLLLGVGRVRGRGTAAAVGGLRRVLVGGSAAVGGLLGRRSGTVGGLWGVGRWVLGAVGRLRRVLLLVVVRLVGLATTAVVVSIGHDCCIE
jgi:hypothetical protein